VAAVGFPWTHFAGALRLIVVIGAFFIVAEMKCRAYEAAGQVKITRNATFTGVFDMKGSTIGIR
jgi:hypothetical protein